MVEVQKETKWKQMSRFKLEIYAQNDELKLRLENA